VVSFTESDDVYDVKGTESDELDFLGGADTLRVWRGSVAAHLGAGNDVAILRGGSSTIFGDAGADTIHVFAGAAIIDTGNDDDLLTIRGDASVSAALGAGNDRVNFYADIADVSIAGGEGADRFFGYEHHITGLIQGGAANDEFYRFGSGVTLAGGEGNDIYRIGSADAPTIVELASEGTDTLQVAKGLSFTLGDNIENLVVLASGSGSGATLIGNDLDNRMTGSSVGEVLDGSGGNDSLYGMGGDDFLVGGAGNDVLNGGAGNDAMVGGAGDDSYYVDSASDVIVEVAGEGTDIVRSTASSYALSANVENGKIATASGATLIGNELANSLAGNSGHDVLYGLDGDDLLNGGDGDDTLHGGAGNDTLTGGLGTDQLAGGTGDDTYYLGSSDSVLENAGEGIDTVVGPADQSMSISLSPNVENATLRTAGQVDGNELDNLLVGSALNDFFMGEAGNDVIYGNEGADFLGGNSGNDFMDAGAGNDTLTNGEGDDVMNGGDGEDVFYHEGFVTDFGHDIVTGGPGADIFTYSAGSVSLTSYDTITDFEAGVDTLYLGYLDANANVTGDQAFTWVSSPTGALGELWAQDLGNGNYVIFANMSGDAQADGQWYITMADPLQPFSPADIVL